MHRRRDREAWGAAPRYSEEAGFEQQEYYDPAGYGGYGRGQAGASPSYGGTFRSTGAGFGSEETTEGLDRWGYGGWNRETMGAMGRSGSPGYGGGAESRSDAYRHSGITREGERAGSADLAGVAPHPRVHGSLEYLNDSWGAAGGTFGGGYGTSGPGHASSREALYPTGISDEDRAPFRGVGPRGYRRSDERIYEDVNERLTEHPAIDASGIEVKVEDGIVTLGGEVDDRWARRLADGVASDVPGVVDVFNEIRVNRETTDRR